MSLHKTDGQLKMELDKRVPMLPMGQVCRDDSCWRAAGTSVVSTRPPSSASTSGSSSRVSTPRTVSFSSTNSSVAGNKSRNSSIDGRKHLTAKAAAHDLRTFNQWRRPTVNKHPKDLQSCSPVPMEELLLDLAGGNGSRKKRNAEEELERRRALQAERDLKARLEKDVLRQQQREKEEWLKKAFEEQEEKAKALEEEERVESERQAMQRAREEKKHLRHEARKSFLSQLQQPKTCTVCEGSGKCLSCSGTGLTSVTYLSATVSDASQIFNGRTFTGCISCGGKQIGSELLHVDVKKGHGRCSNCEGLGEIRASEEEAASAYMFLL